MTTSHRFPVRVYYEDTDFSGNVYHAAYLHFFERGRTEFLRAEGVHHSELIEEGIAFAVRSMEIDFPRAAQLQAAGESGPPRRQGPSGAISSRASTAPPRERG